MINKIALKIADRLKADVNFLSWIDDVAASTPDIRVVGIAKVLNKRVATEAGNTDKKFPVYFNNNKTTCNADDYIDLVPNTKSRSIVYFEDIGTSLNNCSGRYYDFDTVLRLVFWCNLKLINKDLTDTADLQAIIIQNVIGRIDNFDYITKIQVDLSDIPEKSVSIFAEYDYDEAENQFLMYPYDFFAIDFNVRWSMPKICADDIVIDPDPCPK